MADSVATPRRRRSPTRLSADETIRRMLDTGVEMVRERGLMVSFDLMRLEEVIARAGVARAAVYNHWKSKDAYYSDLLRELGRVYSAPVFVIGTGDEATRLLQRAQREIDSAEGRRAIFVELCRLGVRETKQELAGSPSQVYVRVALLATMVSLPDDDELKLSLAQLLGETEGTALGTIGRIYEWFCTTLGYRLVPGLPIGWLDMAKAGFDLLGGNAFEARTENTVGITHFVGDPFGTGDEREWDSLTLAYARLMASYVEPDPAFDDAALARSHERLVQISSRDDSTMRDIGNNFPTPR